MSLLEWLKIWSKFYRIPLFWNTEYPPPENENCQRSLHFDFSVSEYPPPRKLKFRQILALCHLLFSFRIPPLPKNLNLGRSWHFVTFQFQNTPPPPTPHPRKLKFRQILALCDFSVSEYPPPPENWNLGRSWHFVTFQFQNTPPPNPPPRKLKFRQIFPMGNFVWQVTTCGDFIQPG